MSSDFSPFGWDIALSWYIMRDFRFINQKMPIFQSSGRKYTLLRHKSASYRRDGIKLWIYIRFFREGQNAIRERFDTNNCIFLLWYKYCIKNRNVGPPSLGQAQHLLQPQHLLQAGGTALSFPPLCDYSLPWLDYSAGQLETAWNSNRL